MRAIVLSAGYGTRLGELTQDMPKPALDVEGRPMLELIVRHLAAHHVRGIAINLHYRPEVIEELLGDGSRLGADLHYVYEPELLGTAGGVANAGDYLSADGTFLVQYGDVVTDQDLTRLVEFHRRREAVMTILVHRRLKSNSMVAFDENGRVSSFLERPSEELRERAASPWVNSGIAICEPEVLSLIPSRGASDLPRDVFPALVARRALCAFPLTGYRCAVDSPRRLDELRRAVRHGDCRIAGA